MRTNYKINSGVRFKMLSQDQLQSLYDGVLHVLEYTGLDVHHEEARDILQKAGAWVDDIRVRIPSYLVKRSLEIAPRSFTVFARDGNPNHDIPIGHKVALSDLAEGDTVIKYGEDIGKMVASAGKGDHVHTHNLKTKRW